MTLDDLLAKVATETTVEKSLETLTTGISQQLKELQATVDPTAAAKIASLIAGIRAGKPGKVEAIATGPRLPPDGAEFASFE